jgi:hypothetical protein
MSSFDYNAPAELFLSKPPKGSRTKYRRFATAARTWKWVASTAAKFNASMKPMTIRCGSLSERVSHWGLLRRQIPGGNPTAPLRA